MTRLVDVPIRLHVPPRMAARAQRQAAALSSCRALVWFLAWMVGGFDMGDFGTVGGRHGWTCKAHSLLQPLIHMECVSIQRAGSTIYGHYTCPFGAGKAPPKHQYKKYAGLVIRKKTWRCCGLRRGIRIFPKRSATLW